MRGVGRQVSHQAASGSMSETVLAANWAGTSTVGCATGVEQPVNTRAIDAASAATTKRPAGWWARLGGFCLAWWDGESADGGDIGVDSSGFEGVSVGRDALEVVSVASAFGRHARSPDAWHAHAGGSSAGRSMAPASRSLAMDCSNSWALANSSWRPVTRFSRRPANAPGVASLRSFNT